MTTPIAQTNNFIVLDSYDKIEQFGSYQKESELEHELINDLIAQGYEHRTDLKTQNDLLANVRRELECLNDVAFTDSEWGRFCVEYLDKPSENVVDKTRKLHNDHIKDFVFDDGRIYNIALVDKKNITRNKLQVISQFKQTGTHANRYDVTILVNGIPMVHIELKKRGVSIREAFNQIHRYSKESFNSDSSLFKYLQIFVISNGTDTRYFANTTKRSKNSFDFTMNWARSDNTTIKDLKDFTATFFQKHTLLNVLLRYSVFDVSDTLLIMRPYQIAATERILWKIHSSFNAKNWSNVESGGYIWHTTGSGKTLTSFKSAQLATELPFIDQVFFVVDRKDLDYQTMKEYQKFSPDSVNGSSSTKGLKENLQKDDNKIIVTTIQKLNNLIKSEPNLPIYDKQVVFIFDECHRSQFGEAQKNIQRKFKKYYQFGFTGTPIFAQNALTADTTASVFGRELHSYVITDAIRDEKVLKFKVDYHNVKPAFKDIESEQDLGKLSAYETRQALLHPERIREVSRYILDNFRYKTRRLGATGKGFNAMFAVSSVDAAKLYYESLTGLQKDSPKPLTIATIFSYTANEEQDAVGDITDESFEPTALDSTAREFLDKAIGDYNARFKQSFGTDSQSFENYYKDLAKRVKNQEIDLLIVVGMFLTGFDAPTLNTLFVDKNLRYHGLIQAYSRTNRIYDATKPFGNIVTFRDLEKETVAAIELFGDKNTKNIILEKSFDEYMTGHSVDGEARRGYLDIVAELHERFANPDNIIKEKDKKDFVKLFSEYLKVENILQNYDEFAGLTALQNVDKDDTEAIADIQQKYGLDDEDVAKLQAMSLPSPRLIQDYRSTYNDIREWTRNQKEQENAEKSKIDWSDVVFEIALLKSQEINLDYILELIFDKHKRNGDKSALVDEIRHIVRSSLDNRAKESLVVDFINATDLDAMRDKAHIMEEFYTFAKAEQEREAMELIESENLNQEPAMRYIQASLRREYATDNGTELNDVLPKLSPLNPKYLTQKQSVFAKIVAFVEKFRGIGGLFGE
ncbi:type I restriction endonuclease subunit R [Moraxella nasovis]|uniref:type I restriction endonuclease subunit R n=1 Tax=Moraxella nasovis TaxID=2904121 RepID=UPI001F60B107|nr:type I restriction endonuclease subunit R [Moraxella nasovis]UNU72558.1 type I restriction endonuclease subunit R [Moraxella nasovis]